uniref:C3H1-type domain-containing protein n=1 Tax=Strigamia maritima TaxID=126957 RepID=T1JBB2_STRMM
MLATSGYFKNIPCPFFENGLCERPHCHFKHVRKKDSESGFPVSEEENPADLLRIVNEAVKRMEKEVESGVIDTDEVEVSSKEKPGSKSTKTVLEYKPTPIAQLKKMQQENKYAKAMTEQADELEYDPLTNYSAGLTSKVTIPVSQSNKIPYVPSKRSVLAKMKEKKQTVKKINIEYEEDGNSSLSDLELMDRDLVIATSSESSPLKEKASRDDKFDIVNQILIESSICEKAISKKGFSTKEVKSKKTVDNKKIETKKSKNSDMKKTSSGTSNSRANEKSQKKEPVKKSKEIVKTNSSSSKSESKKLKSKKSLQSENKKIKLNAKTPSSTSKKSTVSSEKQKSDSKKINIKSPNSSKEEKSTNIKSPNSSKEKKTSAIILQPVSRKEENDIKMLSDFESSEDDEPIDIVSTAFASISDSDLDEHDTEAECRRIFEEFVPTQPVPNGQFKAVKRELTDDDLTNVSQRKRVAHEGCSQNRTTTHRSNQASALPKVSASQAMLNRYAKLKQLREEGENSIAVPSTSSNSAFLSTVSSTIGKKRIAHVPNVSALINPVSVPKTKQIVHQSAMNTTVAQTTTKGGNRIAHLPTQLSPRPMITQEYGSKVPTNVRQRYLNLIIDECLKLYPDEKDAYTRALSEEKNSYSRSSNRSVYLNVAVNTIHRIRNEINGVMPQSPPSSAVCAPVAKAPRKNSQNCISHEFVLGGKKAANVSYSIERRRSSTEEISLSLLCESLQPYILTKEQLDENGFPRQHPTEPGKAIILKQDPKKKAQDLTDRICCRCGTRFKVTLKGVYLNREECVYHWGRAHKRRVAGTLDNRYNCCQGDLESEGCCVSQLHVSENVQYDNLRGFVTTMQKSASSGSSYDVYALDCEMSYTVQGSELTRITVIDWQSKPVYETLVKPDNPIVDYNTKFSGITENDMEGVTTTLRDVQAVLLNKFSNKTILIGHSLESDFQALKFIHDTVVDTSVVFPHRLGPPYKRALRNLMADYLNKIIQNMDGHDSQEDAVACMELMLFKNLTEIYHITNSMNIRH